LAEDFQSGAAWIPVRPEFKGFHKTVATEFAKLTPMVRSLGQQMGADFAASIRRGLGAGPISEPIREDTSKQKRTAPKQGAEVGGAFAQGFRRSVAAAMRNLPEAEIGADATPAQAELARLRGELEELAGKTVGVDVDAAVAVGELQAIRDQLDQLGEGAEVDVRADTAATSAQIGALLAQIAQVDSSLVTVAADTGDAQEALDGVAEKADGLDGRRPRVDLDVSGALRGIGLLATGAAALASIPVGATLVAGVGALTPVLASAAAGAGALALVAAPAITEVSDALALQEQAAAGSEAALEKYNAALAEMDPATRGLMDSYTGLREEFTAWRTEMNPAVLPVLSNGMGLLSGRFQALTPLVEGSAGAVDGLIDRLDTALGSDFYTEFGQRLTELAPTAITGLGATGGNLATGAMGVVNAFLPYAPQVLDYIERISAGFAEWGTGLDGSAGVGAFMDYVITAAPLVEDFVVSLAGAALNLVTSLAPLGPVALGGFTPLLQVVGQLSPQTIQILAMAITGVVLATRAWAVSSLFFGKSAPIAAKGIKGIGTSLKGAFMSNPVGIIITAITALIPLVMWAWDNVDWFRNGILAAWESIKTASLWLWETVLQPVFNGLVDVINTYVVPAVMWLWTHAFQPVFGFIGTLVQSYWKYYLQPVFQALTWVIMNVVVPAVTWLWTNVFKPVFGFIGLLITTWWHTQVKPVWDALVWVWQQVIAPAAMWLWHNVMVPVWNGISTAIDYAWNSVIKPVFNWLSAGITRYIVIPFLTMRARVMYAWGLLRIGLQAGWAWIRDNVFTRIRSGVDAVRGAFRTAADGIKTVWARIKGYTKDPINFVIQTVYMDGIRSLAGKVLSAVGVEKNPLPSFDPIATGGIWNGPGHIARYRSGGVLPGYTPGRDVHRFYSPTGGGLELSGGEAILRPEVTRVLGPSMIHEINGLARTGGVPALRRRFEATQAFHRGGIYGGPPVQSFNRGGIMSALSGSWDWVEGKADEISGAAKKWFTDQLGLSELLSAIPGGGFLTDFARGLFRSMLVPRIADLIGKRDDEAGGSSAAVVRVATKYAKTPGLVGGDYNNKFQRAFGMPGQPWCAMFVSEVIKEARAKKQYNNISHAHSRAFRDGLPKGKASAAKPGWIATYGSEPSHINIIAYRKNGQNYTIGGNEGNTVKGPRVYGAATNVMKPKFARGGILDPRVLAQDYRENRAGTTPIQTQFLRTAFGLPAYAGGGWIRGRSGDRNLVLGANGEYVMRAAVAEENAGLLEALNSGRQLGDILAAAGPAAVPASAPAALAGLSAAARPGPSVSAELHLHDGQATVREAFRELRYEAARFELAGKYRRG
jgi:hypothetical protein